MSFESMNSAMEFDDDYKGVRFLGKVTQNIDPEKLDRIQAEVPGLYDSSLGDLPWIGPDKMSSFGFGNGYGVFGTPAIGSDVQILLQNGDPHYPMYRHNQRYAAPDDFPSGTSWGFKDPTGNKLVILTNKDVKFTSASGVVIEIDPSGNIKVDNPGNTDITTQGSTTVTAQSDMTLNAGGDMTLNAGHLTVNAPTTINGDTDTHGGFTNNGVNTGDSHKHGGISRGGSVSDGAQ